MLSVVSWFRADEFKVFFRVTRTVVEHLEEWICRICLECAIAGIVGRQGMGGSKPKTLYEHLLVMLWYLSSQDKYSAIADRFGVSESTANVAIRELLVFLNENLRDTFICWPTHADKVEISGKYEQLKNFPGVVGMIDGSHIPIRMPPDRGIDYYNQKDFYSVVLQAVCREDLRFTNVYCGWPGKVHDARIFRHSPLFEEGPGLCGRGLILADSAFPNLNWVLSPFRDNGHLTIAQRRFNETHASIRSTIERAFGLLKGRFSRLQHIDQRNTQTIVTTVLAACVLHNICIFNNDDFEDVLFEDDGDVVPQCGPHPANFNANAQERGANKRLAIARRL